MHFDEWLLVPSLLLFFSILAWKVSNRLGIPALLLFLGIGMQPGSDGPGGIYFDNASVAQAVGVVALALILFAGGLDSDWKVVRPTLGSCRYWCAPDCHGSGRLRSLSALCEQMGIEAIFRLLLG